jgi:hypothetical protein
MIPGDRIAVYTLIGLAFVCMAIVLYAVGAL